MIFKGLIEANIRSFFGGERPTLRLKHQTFVSNAFDI